MAANDNLADPVHSPRWIEALNAQATIIMAIFARAGFEPIAPPVIQPADVFLDVIGEDLRARTYVFTDPDGAELCLRPDLTIPACRHYLATLGSEFTDAAEPAVSTRRLTTGQPKPQGKTAQVKRLSYNGVVFRYQPAGDSLARPREFRQAGIESFAADNPAKAEAEILALSIESVRAAGLRAFRVHIGDLGIFNALLNAIAMPERWRAQLLHYFWQPEAFRAHLQRLVQPGQTSRALPLPMLGQITSANEAEAVAVIERHITERGLTIAGTRTLEEIAVHLRGHGQDLLVQPLAARSAEVIEAYLKIEAPAEAAPARIRRLLSGTGIDIEPALKAYEERLKLASQEGIDISQAAFSAGFGRAFEYYTGFVFEILSPALGDTTPIGGGGRYDTLVKAISGSLSVPAVGAALHTERLLLAVRGGRP